jgi:hypothetical protein
MIHTGFVHAGLKGLVCEKVGKRGLKTSQGLEISRNSLSILNHPIKEDDNRNPNTAL